MAVIIAILHRHAKPEFGDPGGKVVIEFLRDVAR